MRIRLVGTRAQSIEVAAGFTPSKIVDYGEIVAPEDGGAVRDGEDA